MEPHYICEFDVSFEEYKYWAKHPLGSAAVKSRRKSLVLRGVGCALSVLLIAMGLAQSEFYLTLCGAAFLCIFLARMFLTDNIILKKQYTLFLKAQPGGVWKRTFRFTDKLTIEDGRSVSSYAYGEIKRHTEDERYFVLWLSEDMVMRLPKAAFTAGEPARFLDFVEAAAAGEAKAEG